ncbi:MAG: alpha/beta fold hydrolase [Bacteroidota bacterium]
MVDKQSIEISCTDGIVLSAALYVPPSKAKAAVMVAPATGIKKTFYNSFAMHLAEQGYGVICFDNRGIGDSNKGPINAHNASLIHWGRLDMTAVLDELMKRFPGTSYHLIGHSAGGQLLGLMENAAKVRSMFNFASSSGSLRNMHYPYKILAAFFLNVFIPMSNLVFGQANCQWVGMGEPLPKAVAKQWSRWCNGAGYVATDFGKAIDDHYYDELKLPSKWLHATDDGIAILENVQDMIRVYSQMPAEIVTLRPEDWGYTEIGHMKFFSSRCQELWPMALDWLEAHRG